MTTDDKGGQPIEVRTLQELARIRTRLGIITGLLVVLAAISVAILVR